MSLGMTIVMLIAGWVAVAAAMLWGVLRITRRHQRRLPAAKPAEPPSPVKGRPHAALP
jgi:hypothetical protein